MTKNEPRRISFTICSLYDTKRAKQINLKVWSQNYFTSHVHLQSITRAAAFSDIQNPTTSNRHLSSRRATPPIATQTDNDPWIEIVTLPYSRGAPDQISRTPRPPHAATCHINYAISVPSLTTAHPNICFLT